MKSKTKSILITIFALILISGCNIPTPQQMPGDPTPDLNVILTEIALADQPTEAPVASPSEGPSEGPAEGPTDGPADEPSPTAGPTAAPKKTETLTVCLGKEPATLFFYDESSRAMWSVLESIYDGPFDTGDGTADPVIFTGIDIAEETVTVQRGDIIVDITGNAVELKPGISFLPAVPAEGCSGSACLRQWTAVSETAEIIRTVITFHLREDLRWSDGTALTAEDSVFSMSVNGMKGINASKQMYNLTESYTAVDEHTVEWRGLPGFKPDDPSDVFWIPLPKHVMKGMSAEMIRASEEINTKPLGWGAWQISSWVKGEEIIAERNPYYVLADGTEPFFDRIVYKFYGRPGDNNLAALSSGACDIIDPSVDLSADMEEVVEGVRDGVRSAYIRPELTRQELVFDLDPAQYGAVKLFSEPALRSAIAQCIDRNALNRQLLFGQSEVPADFYPADYSAHNVELEAAAFDPEAARQALDELGWTVSEEDPDGVRIATRASGTMYGTRLAFTLHTGNSAAAAEAGRMISDDLAQCGIAVETEPLSPGELYAQGPDGVIFGRSFDAAVFAWASGSSACSVYMSDQVPSAANHWVGTNVGGYQNETYDEACLLPELTEADVRQIYAEDLPAVPLYFNISVGLSTNNICGIHDRIGSRSILWNMEQFSRSEDRCAVSQWNNIY